MEWDICAPGPSMSQALVNGLRGRHVGVVGLVFELAPWAQFLCANDVEWWTKYPHALDFRGHKYSANKLCGVELLEPGCTNWSSGVLALSAARNHGATLIRLHGFDHQGSHYFGPYTNGLTNTPDYTRDIHARQFRFWKDANPHVQVINCTAGSALTCFPFAEAA